MPRKTFFLGVVGKGEWGTGVEINFPPKKRSKEAIIPETAGVTTNLP